MQRRSFLRMATLSGLLAGSGSSQLLATAQNAGAGPTVETHTVLLVAKCHLDVGFTTTQRKVMRKYFDLYFPQAIRTAAQLRESGGDRYIWTTGSWLLYEYLEQASKEERGTAERAIAAGDLCWHALPFSWQTEMMSRSLISGSLGFSAVLDQRFGHKTIGAKMTDVPGHTRGLVAPLVAGGVRLLDIGVNAASTPPEVPDLFVWKDKAGNALPVMYHRHDYGGIVSLPSGGVAVAVEVRGDNSGPHTPAEISAIYAKLQARFPNAQVRASNLNEVAAAVDRVRDVLPVITAEIGDTWIYGCASDPVKVARYREVARLREGWLAKGSFAVADTTDRNLLRHMLLETEHTWGTDTKTYLDNDHYRPSDLARVLDQPGYLTMEQSWQEKRADLDEALATLPATLQSEAQAGLSALAATPVALEGMQPHDPAVPFATRHFDLQFDAATGAIYRLGHRASGREWASATHPLALFTYQTLSSEDYVAFLKGYVTSQADWAPRDFGKPGMEKTGAASREWHPSVLKCWSATDAMADRIVLELAVQDAGTLVGGNVAWPSQIFLELTLPVATPLVDLRLLTRGKVANRLPEAMWLTFQPANVSAGGLTFTKTDETVQPLDVVRGGGRAMHAIQETLRWQDSAGHALSVHTLDAPVVALGKRTPLNFSFDPPDLLGGVHFSLFNNAWGTNYPQWSGGDWQFRFQLVT